MPRKCCVPGCKSNYTSVIDAEGAKSTFSLPKDADLRQAWLRAIRRKNWMPSKHSVVCREHFAADEVETEEVITDSDGHTFRLALRYPRLVAGAIPHIFKAFPSPLSASASSAGKNPIKRNAASKRRYKEHASRSSASASSAGKNPIKRNAASKRHYREHGIATFQDLIKLLPAKLNDMKWSYKVQSDTVYLYLLNIDLQQGNGEVKVINSVSVDSNLIIKVYVGGRLLCHNELSWLLPSDLKLSRWSQVETILNRYTPFTCEVEEPTPSPGTNTSTPSSSPGLVIVIVEAEGEEDMHDQQLHS